MISLRDRRHEAIENFKRGIEIMPYYNPGMLNLAAAYRAVGTPAVRVRAPCVGVMPVS